MITKTAMTILATSLAATLAIPVTAMAEGECQQDRQTFCKNETRANVGACLDQHTVELSEACKAMREARALASPASPQTSTKPPNAQTEGNLPAAESKPGEVAEQPEFNEAAKQPNPSEAASQPKSEGPAAQTGSTPEAAKSAASPEVKNLGQPVSHGCVRISPDNAAILYDLVKTNGMENTKVVLAGVTPGDESNVPDEPAYSYGVAPWRPGPGYFPPPPPKTRSFRRVVPRAFWRSAGLLSAPARLLPRILGPQAKT